MIHLHTLGDTLITVGEKEVRPSAPHVFAALLYLSVERGRRVPRAALRELFFPESDERSGSHSVRQLLYKLRQLGAPVHADDSSVALVEEVIDDTSESALATAGTISLRAGLLPFYAPQVSDGFSRWLQSVRDQRATRIVRVLLKRLKESYEAGSLEEALDLSTAVLSHDPLNEEATLTRAKALAVGGHKLKAVELLDAYSKDVRVDIRLPADSLSRRIQNHAAQPQSEAAFVGRDNELRTILAQHSIAAQGQSALTLIWGEPGIGKTRLVQEVAERVRLEGDRVLWAHCQQHAIGRPIGVLTDLIPALMKCRGSLGVSPRSMDWLRRLEVRSERGGLSESEVNAAETSHQLMLALKDLIGSIATESTILLIVEDIQWIDDASREFLLRHVPGDTRLHVVMTSREGSFATEHVCHGRATLFRKLVPLSSAHASSLLGGFLPSVFVDEPLRRTCVELANGNPLFIRTLAHHFALSGGLPDSAAGITDLMLQRVHALRPPSLLLLRLVSVLGALSTSERLRQCASLDPFALMLAIQELSDRGFVARREAALVCVHQLLADTVLGHTPDSLKAELYVVAASQLEKEGQVTRATSLLWACAEFWCLSGQPERASKALQECAAYAIELGEPRYAIPALERAQEFCHRVDLPPLLEATVRIADLATDDEAVLRNAGTYRQLFQAEPAPHNSARIVELAETRALRRLGKDIWPKRAILLDNALCEEMPLRDRRRAARTYVVSAEESFGGAEAAEQALALSPLWFGKDLDAVELRMLFHLTIGDIEEALPAAKEMLARIDEFPMLAQPVELSAIARVFAVSGHLDESLAVSLREWELARRVGNPSDIGMAAARIADTYLTICDLPRARAWAQTTNEFTSSSPFVRAYHLFNSVTLAIAEGDFTLAQAGLEELKLQDEAKKRQHVRSIAGVSLMLANARGTLDLESSRLDELREIDDSAWHHGEHLLFAVGLFLLLLAEGLTSEAHTRVREYFLTRRRERFDPWIAIEPLHLKTQQFRELQEAVKTPQPVPESPSTHFGPRQDAVRAR